MKREQGLARSLACAAVFACVAVALSAAPSLAAAVIHVNGQTGDDANTGEDWTAAKQTVTAGLAAAESGDQVWVAAGTYVERITLKDGAELYGGFAGNEIELTQRDWATNETTLVGDKPGSVVTSPQGATQTTRIDGFTVRNGRFSGSGVSCVSSSLTIANNIITDNTAPSTFDFSGSGGGIYCAYSSAIIVHNIITANIAPAAGGFGGGAGGGVCCFDSSVTIMGNIITDNAAGSGGSSGIGGGISGSFRSPSTIAGNTISGNVAGAGGGIWSSGSVTIANNAIIANSAHEGGGIYGKGTIVNNTIVANTASSGNAGGIYWIGANARIANTIVAFNSSGMHCTACRFTTVKSNCVFGNTSYNYSGSTDPTGTNGNISADPKLAGWTYGNVHIRPDSPCVNAGDKASIPADTSDLDGDGNSTESLPFDLDGQSRIQPEGGDADIGADESDGTAWPEGPYAIVRVSPDGDDSNDGSSWALSKRTVQAGLDTASAAGGEVWVKTGTYFEQITLRRFVYLYGGFRAVEAARDERDFRVNTTVLDGQQAGSVVTIRGAGLGLVTIDGFTVKNGSGYYGYCGGGICGMDLSCPTIVNNTITENSATFGGGLFCAGSPRIADNVITRNVAYGGGGIYSQDASPTIVNNTITANTASSLGGGGICARNSSPTITNNAITANTATDGGGIFSEWASPKIANNTIARNTASSGGGGLFCSGYPSSSLTIVNTIIAFNSSGICCAATFGHSPTLTLASDCVSGNTAYNYYGLTDPTGTNGNISVDPRFVDGPGGDFHLTATSPCVNAGDPAGDYAGQTDMDGEPRVAYGRVDIGADEFLYRGGLDFDLDTDVDLTDFGFFRACFAGPNRPYPNVALCPQADLDGDADVDVADFLKLQACFNGPNRPPKCE